MRRLSVAERLSRLAPAERSKALAGINPDTILRSWRIWARPEQIEPKGDWNLWMIKAGRGWGKTRTGAEWVRERAKNQAERIALVGRTAADVRDTMVEGASGLMSVFPDSERPLYEPSKRRVTFKSGAMASCFSADEPDALRGPNFSAFWGDELAAWRFDRDAWDNLMFGFRMGAHPRGCITTTPRPSKLVREILARPDCVITGGSTYENAGNVAESFLSTILSRYEGTRLGRQEINAEVLDDNPGSLWSAKVIEANRVRVAPAMRRLVVAIDPAVTSKPDSDETGIIAGGIGTDGHGYVLNDLSGNMPALEWARAAVGWYKTHKADRVVAEVNNGGDLVGVTLRTVDPNVSFRAVNASRGKAIRAEPVAALYEQCIAAGTEVQMEHGRKAIESVRAGDMVMTRAGAKRVLWAGKTAHRETLIIETAHGSVRCTSDHPIFVEGKGWIHAGQLVPNKHNVLLCKTHAPTVESQSRASVDASPAPRKRDGKQAGNQFGNSYPLTGSDTSGKLTDTGGQEEATAVNCYTEPSGKKRMGTLLPAHISTIATETMRTTGWRTLSNWIRRHTALLIQDRRSAWLFARSYLESTSQGGQRSSRLSIDASIAAGYSLAEEPVLNIALQPVTQSTGITSVRKAGPVDLYDLMVEDQPEFFAGGILVHNCRIHHVGSFPILEDQMASFDPLSSKGSPDRMDALVWLMTELMLGPGGDVTRARF